MDFFLPIVFGLTYGIIVGSAPGLGVLGAILLVLPLMQYFDSLQVLLFYAALMSTVQYIGSVVAIYFGVPGENTSLIASKLGHSMATRHMTLLSDLIVGTAIGSFIAALMGLFIMFAVIATTTDITWMNGIYVKIILLLLVLAVLLQYRNQKIHVNFLLVVLGFFIGSLGLGPISMFNWTFGQDWLIPGVNQFLLILMLFVLPNFYWTWQHQANSIALAVPRKKVVIKTKALLRRWQGIIRGSALGAVAGLIPGVGTSVSSQMAYDVETKISKKPIQQLLSAESANNAAVITVLIPLIVLGMPIIASEALILDFITFKGTVVGLQWFLNDSIYGFSNIAVLMMGLFMANVLAFFVAWRLAPALAYYYQLIPLKVFIVLLILLLTGLLVYNSVMMFTYYSDIIIALCLTPLMIYITAKKIDSLPLVFAFMLATQLHSVIAAAISFIIF